jgi:RNA 3'-terminal phosphate cyclase (ATP)
MRRAGARLELELVASGFYPAGGGEVVMTVTPSEVSAPLHLAESGVLARLELRAIVGGLSEGIARRELAAAAELLTDTPVTLASETVRSVGPGNAMWLVARDEGTGLCNVFSGIGESGVPAEDVGREVAEQFLAWRASGASIEPHLADQVMLPIALAGAGSFTCNELTLHARTNLEVIRAFTGHRLRVWDLGTSRFRVALG